MLCTLPATRRARAGARRRQVGRSGQDAAHRHHHRRDRLRSAGVAGSLLEHDQLGDLRGAVRIRLPGAAAPDRAAHGRWHAGDLGRRSHLEDQGEEGNLLRRRSGLQGDEARAHRARLCLFVEAPGRSQGALAQHLPHPRQVRGTRRCREEREGRQARLRRRDRGAEGARPLHAADQVHRARLHVPAVPHRDADGGGGARSRGSLWRRERLGDGQPGRHRRVSPEGVAARATHHPRGESQLSRGVLPAVARQCRRRREGRVRGDEGQAPAAGGTHRGGRDRGIESAAARLQRRRARHDPHPARPRVARARRQEPPAAGLRRQGDPDAARSRGRARLLRLLQHERSGGGRLHAGEDRAAPRAADGLQRERDGAGGTAGPGHAGDATHPARGAGSRAGIEVEHAVRSQARDGAARQVRLQGPRRRRLPRDCRTASRWRWSWARPPPARTASATSCG